MSTARLRCMLMLIALMICAAALAADPVPTTTPAGATIWIVCEPIHNKGATCKTSRRRRLTR